MRSDDFTSRQGLCKSDVLAGTDLNVLIWRAWLLRHRLYWATGCRRAENGRYLLTTAGLMIGDYEAGYALGNLGEELARTIRQAYSCTELSRESHTVRYFDTFDWRLYRKNVRLRWESGRLVLATGPVGGIYRLLLDRIPRFAWEFPECPLREQIEKAAWIRGLFPVVELKLSGRDLLIHDTRQKTVGKIALLEGAAIHPLDSERSGELTPTVFLTGLKGFEAVTFELKRLIEKKLGKRAVWKSQLEWALASIGRVPGDYSSKFQADLHPSMNTIDAVRTILRILYGTLVANEDGVRQDLDPEFLHDFRVAVRRARSLLGQLKGVLPQEVADPLRRELAWLGTTTGPTRDLDVYLLRMRDYENHLPGAFYAQLEPLVSFLKERQKQEQSKLKTRLASKRFEQLKDQWQRIVDCPLEYHDSIPAAHSIARVGSEKVWNAYKRVLKKGRSLDELKPETFHELRIDCKKLRYLLEFFRSLYEPRTIKKLVGSLKELQDTLGEYNDFQVQRAKLHEFALGMSEKGDVPAETLLAMGRLVERLEQAQHAEKSHFADHFARFSRRPNRKLFERLFSPKGRAVSSS